jgi:hypothetical protein
MVLAILDMENVNALSVQGCQAYVIKHLEKVDVCFYILADPEHGKGVLLHDTNRSIQSTQTSEDILNELYAFLQTETVVVREDIKLNQILSTNCEHWLVQPLSGRVSPDGVTFLSESVESHVASRSEKSAKISYKDALSRRSLAPKSNNNVKPVVAHPKWEPKFVLKPSSKIRIDREYGPQQQYVDEDEDLGTSDLTDMYYTNKASVGMGRYRNMTLLTPAALEKKNMRIAAKAKETTT